GRDAGRPPGRVERPRRPPRRARGRRRGREGRGPRHRVRWRDRCRPPQGPPDCRGRGRPGRERPAPRPVTRPATRPRPRGETMTTSDLTAGAPEPFGARLHRAVAERGRLCVGIDPHASLLEAWGLSDDVAGLERFALGAVEALAPEVSVVKPQSAFY